MLTGNRVTLKRRAPNEENACEKIKEAYTTVGFGLLRDPLLLGPGMRPVLWDILLLRFWKIHVFVKKVFVLWAQGGERRGTRGTKREMEEEEARRKKQERRKGERKKKERKERGRKKKGTRRGSLLIHPNSRSPAPAAWI